MNIAGIHASSQRRAVGLHDLTELISGRPILGIMLTHQVQGQVASQHSAVGWLALFD